MYLTVAPVGWALAECPSLCDRLPAACVQVLDARASHALLRAIYWCAAGREPTPSEHAWSAVASGWRVQRVDALLEVIEEFGRELEAQRAYDATEPRSADERPRVRSDGVVVAGFECAGWTLNVTATRGARDDASAEWVYALESALDEYGDEIDRIPPDVQARFTEVSAGSLSFGPSARSR